MYNTGSQRYSFGLFAQLLVLLFCGTFTATFAGCTGKEINTPSNTIDTIPSDTSGSNPIDTSITPTDTTTSPPADTVRAFTYLALGDSYTIGQSVATDERFPHQTAQLLRNKGFNITPSQYIAQTGWTTANLLSAISTTDPVANFDIVTLLIGVNNQYQHRDTAEYRSQFIQCLTQAILHANGNKAHVFVLSIPDYSATPYGQNNNPAQIATEMTIFNNICKSVTSSYGVTYINITPSTQEAINDPTLVAPDGLHPSGKLYARWAEMLAPEVEKILK